LSLPLAWQLCAVAGGGAFGAVARWAVNRLFLERGWLGIPAATLGVNVVGCLLAGLLLVWIDGRGQLAPFWRQLLLTGFLGAFTTFSALGVELWQFLRAGRIDLAVLASAAHLVLGVLAVATGYWLGRLLMAEGGGGV
jgi:fluoride exporter